MDGVYQPITIVHTDETHHWGHSEVLNLDVCWEDEQLRFWDPAEKRYLRAHDEERHGRITTAARAAQARADTALAERDAALACIQKLEEELRRSQGR